MGHRVQHRDWASNMEWDRQRSARRPKPTAKHVADSTPAAFESSINMDLITRFTASIDALVTQRKSWSCMPLIDAEF
jgi:hypothetical protein